jgi:hypothetical protein
MAEHPDSGVVLQEIPEPDPAAFALPGREISPEELPALEEPDGARRLVTEAAAAGDAAVRIARGQSDVHESGGPNGGLPHERYVQYFGRNLPPLPWCAFFVSWCFAQAGYRPPWRNPGYVGSVHEWAAGHGRLVQQPAHGDMFGFGDSHMGLVVGANPGAGQIYTIEGNYGDRVASRLLNYRGTGIWFARY